MWAEMSDLSRVVFPVDWNSAVACLRDVFRSHGAIWTMVVPKREVPDVLSPELAQRVLADGAVCLRDVGGDDPELILVAVGAYQLAETLTASDRLKEKSVRHRVIVMVEPGRFRSPRDDHEAKMTASDATLEMFFPETAGGVFQSIVSFATQTLDWYFMIVVDFFVILCKNR